MLRRLCCRFGFFAFIAAIVTTPLGAAEFIKTYGGPDSDVARSIVETADGGFLVAGFTSSFGAGNTDLWVFKLDASGHVEFEKTYGGPDTDVAWSVVTTADGGFAVAGHTGRFLSGISDFWVLKLDATGNVVFERSYEFPGSEFATSMVQTTDGGFAVAGGTPSSYHGIEKFKVLKLDATGNIVFDKTYGGIRRDLAYSIVATADGGFAVAGSTESFGAGGADTWVLKLDASGNVEFERTYGGSGSEFATSMVQTTDGGFAVAGYTSSFGAGGVDLWFLKLDATGNVVFEKTYGGLSGEGAWSVVATADGGFAVAGQTLSFGAIGGDAWFLKLDATGNVVFEKRYGGPVFSLAWSIVATADGGFGMAGQTALFGAGGSDAWVLKLDGNGEVPACGLGVDTDAIVTETAAIVQEHGVEGVPSNATVTDTAAMVTDMMSVVERQCGVTCEPRGLGFWKHQCSGQGFTQVPPTELADHFFTLEADSSVFPECAPSGCAAFDGKVPRNDMRGKAEQQFLALELNLASRRLELACPADTDQTVEDILATIEPALCDPQAFKSELETVKDLAEGVNAGGLDMELATLDSSLVVRPGEQTSIELALINMSPDRRDYALSAMGPWPVTLSKTEIHSLGSGRMALVTATVTIPDSAEGQTGPMRFVATDLESGGSSKSKVDVTLSVGITGGDDGRGGDVKTKRTPNE